MWEWIWLRSALDSRLKPLPQVRYWHRDLHWNRG